MKKELSIFLGGLFVGLVLLGFVFVFSSPTPKVEISDKMKECIDKGGQFFIRDYSYRVDESDYKMTCFVPEHRLWQYDF